jgi:hypothetical protein
MTMSHLGELKEADAVLRAICFKKSNVREIGVSGLRGDRNGDFALFMEWKFTIGKAH